MAGNGHKGKPTFSLKKGRKCDIISKGSLLGFDKLHHGGERPKEGGLSGDESCLRED